MAVTNHQPAWDPDHLDAIFQQTLDALHQGREQMHDIADTARQEYERVQQQLLEVRQEAAACISAVDDLEVKSQAARSRLRRVSQDFASYSEDDIRSAYTRAEELHGQLLAARERESALRQKRDDTERALKNLEKMVEKANNLVSQVSLAMKYLVGNLEEMAGHIEGMQNQARMGHRIIAAQEDERHRVAREIHDGPAQFMANVVLRAEICERLLQSDREQLHDELEGLKLLVKDGLQALRKIIFNLRPMALDDLGLIPALRRYLENMRQQGRQALHLRVTGREARLPTATEVTLFRVVQEAVENALRHAQAERVMVSVDFKPDVVRLEVEDNGIGFDLDAVMAQDRDHFGILRIKERLLLLAGELEVKTAPGHGTRVVTLVPRHVGAEEAAD